MLSHGPFEPPAPALATRTARTLCAGCGVVAPVNASLCAVCRIPLVRVAQPVTNDDTFWVAVRCAFQCRSCNFAAPLDHLDVDGAVDCVHCGVRQRFDIESWRDSLAFAHAVGDLAGPDPEGRSPHPAVWIGGENPHRGVGVGETFGELAQTGSATVDGLILPRTLRIEAAPGHPPCRRCHAPLTVMVRGVGQAETGCSQCGDTGAYVAPDGVATLAPGLLVVLADEHRTDRPRAQESTSSGAQALACPRCGGPLKLLVHDRVASCEFCGAACLIPAHAVDRAGQAPEPRVWWQLWKGPSAKRLELLAPTDAFSVASGMAATVLGPSGRRSTTIPSKPGVFEAPEVDGPKWEQLGVTLLLGSFALLVGYVILGR